MNVSHTQIADCHGIRAGRQRAHTMKAGKEWVLEGKYVSVIFREILSSISYLRKANIPS